MGERMKKSTEEYLHDLRQTTERWWDSTQRTFSSAGERASQYRNVLRSKIDLTSLQRKINSRYTDLGRAVSAAHDQGSVDILRGPEVSALLVELEQMKLQAAQLGGEPVPPGPAPQKDAAAADAEEDLHL